MVMFLVSFENTTQRREVLQTDTQAKSDCAAITDKCIQTVYVHDYRLRLFLPTFRKEAEASSPSSPADPCRLSGGARGVDPDHSQNPRHLCRRRLPSIRGLGFIVFILETFGLQCPIIGLQCTITEPGHQCMCKGPSPGHQGGLALTASSPKRTSRRFCRTFQLVKSASGNSFCRTFRINSL